jgi:hypothetical protein
MPRYTQGFPDNIWAQEKFEDHGTLLGADTMEEYVELADRFLGAPLAELPDVEECPTGEWVRYNLRTRHFGVISEDRTVLFNYYVSEPHRRPGRTFRQYVEDQCLRRWLG